MNDPRARRFNVLLKLTTDGDHVLSLICGREFREQVGSDFSIEDQIPNVAESLLVSQDDCLDHFSEQLPIL